MGYILWVCFRDSQALPLGVESLLRLASDWCLSTFLGHSCFLNVTPGTRLSVFAQECPSHLAARSSSCHVLGVQHVKHHARHFI